MDELGTAMQIIFHGIVTVMHPVYRSMLELQGERARYREVLARLNSNYPLKKEDLETLTEMAESSSRYSRAIIRSYENRLIEGNI